MSDRRRPGGLTALAVLNFVGAGFLILGLAATAAMFALMDKIIENADEADRAQIEQVQELGAAGLITVLVLRSIVAILLIVAGIGYLKLKKVLGRRLGNTYAILSILVTLGSVILLAPEVGGSFGLATVIGLIYPLLTLIFLNTTFKEDFVN